MDAFENGVLGKGTPVLDASLKVTGQLKYVDDLKLPGMLCGKILFSPYAHANILSVDASEAERLEGVHAVVWYKDAPPTRYNGNGEDSDILPSELVFDREVRYVGDKVAAVAAETPEIAEKALRLIRVTYEELPFYLDPRDAAAPGALALHETGNIMEEVKLSAGDLEQGFAQADEIFESEYEVPAIYHAAIEPHVSLSVYGADGKLTVYTPSQDVFGKRKNLAKIFGLPMALAGYIGTAIAISTNVSTEMALTLAVPLGLLGTVWWVGKMSIDSVFVHWADRYAEKGNARGVMLMNWLPSAVMMLFFKVLVTVIICMYGTGLVEAFLTSVQNTGVLHGFEVIGGLLPALGIALNLRAILKKETIAFLLVGFLLVAYFNISIIGVALFGLVIAAIYFQYTKEDADYAG